MSTRVKVPVEPLPRSAWDRIEAGLFERLDQGEHRRWVAEAPPRRRARVWWAFAPVAAALALLALRSPLGLLQPTGSGGAAPEAPPGAPAPIARLAPAPATHIATTDAATRTTIGEATLTLQARSEMHVSGSDAEGWRVVLDRGQVDCDVAPRRGRPPFVVQAGKTRVTVVGTRFTVGREGAEARVHVHEGHVRVQSGAEERTLAPGESWPDEPSAVLRDALPERAAPARTARKARAKHTQHATPRAPRARRSVPDRAAQFSSAARLEASDPDAAIARYRQLAAGKGPWAANALYAQARLELERGRSARAASLLRRYRERYPNGTNTADVEALLRRLDPPGR